MGSGTKLSISGDEVVGSIEGEGDIELGTSRLISVVTPSRSFSGTITGIGGITKTGLGHIALTGVKNNTGTTIVNTGTLSSEGSAMSSDVSVAEGATFLIHLPSANDTVTYSKIISGAGAFSKSGLGELTLDRANSYTGPTLIFEGTLKTKDGGGFSNGTLISVSSGAKYELGSDDEVGSIQGSGDIELSFRR